MLIFWDCVVKNANDLQLSVMKIKEHNDKNGNAYARRMDMLILH